MLRNGLVRASRSARLASSPLPPSLFQSPLFQARYVSQAISNPTLSQIEARWEDMPPQEQADLWMALRDRMKVNWHEMTPHEKKASYYIAFGPHGPRALPDPHEGRKVFWGTMGIIGASLAVFAVIRSFAGPPPKTMTKEWQEATNAYFQEERIEPITGAGAPGYKGQGMIQSKSSGKPLDKLVDEDEE